MAAQASLVGCARRPSRPRGSRSGSLGVRATTVARTSAQLWPTQQVEKVAESEAESEQPSPSESTHHRAITSYSQLFAAALGHVDWLRFCLNREPRERVTDAKEAHVEAVVMSTLKGSGFTAIHFAAQQGKLGCIQVLVEEYKFPVDLPTSHCQTPLHLLLNRDNKADIVPCIHYLLKKGATINSQTCNGSTPLHLAAREGLLSSMKVLVQSGANVHAQDALGCKPIDHCKIWNHRACARFLKDAMWKQDKKDFAHEMGKLKKLKEKLTCMEHNYLIEYQKKHKILREADFKKWLHSKQLPQSHSLGSDFKQVALSKNITKASMSFHPSVEARLQNLPQPKTPPRLIYRRRTIRWPKLWNISNNLSSPPTTTISCPQGIRLGVHPEPSQEHDFRSFLDITQNSLGGAWLRTADGHWVSPVPQLPFEVVVSALYPGVKPSRMKVPQDLRPISILSVSHKRHFGNTCSNTMAMSLRKTFDQPFLATLRAHQA